MLRPEFEVDRTYYGWGVSPDWNASRCYVQDGPERGGAARDGAGSRIRSGLSAK